MLLPFIIIGDDDRSVCLGDGMEDDDMGLCMLTMGRPSTEGEAGRRGTDIDDDDDDDESACSGSVEYDPCCCCRCCGIDDDVIFGAPYPPTPLPPPCCDDDDADDADNDVSEFAAFIFMTRLHHLHS